MGKFKRAPVPVTRVRKRATLTQRIDRRIQSASDKKYLLNIQNGLDVSTFGTVQDHSSIVIGSNFDQRTGLRIHPVSLDYRYEIILGDTSNLVRVTMIQWKQLDFGNPPVLGDIFQNTGTAQPMSPFRYDQEGKTFKVLYDKLHDLNTARSSSETGRILVSQKKLLKEIRYQQDAAVETGTNKIYMIYWSDSQAAVHPQIAYAGTLTYTDI